MNFMRQVGDVLKPAELLVKIFRVKTRKKIKEILISFDNFQVVSRGVYSYKILHSLSCHKSLTKLHPRVTPR